MSTENLFRSKTTSSLKDQKLIRSILKSVPEDLIDLPAPPKNIKYNETEALMKRLEYEIGAAASGDYYKNSRTRFSHIIRLASAHLKAGSKILDIGNAPGLLAQGLKIAGFHIDGLNLNDLWNSHYIDSKMIEYFNVISCDIEHNLLPYESNTFDAIVFTEVLEHIATGRPEEFLGEFKRVLKDDGIILFSTPNVNNISNILALASGINVFWGVDIFYGSTDRHNREFTPTEVRKLFSRAGFDCLEFYGVNDHSNWRAGAAASVYRFLGRKPKDHPLLRNTMIGVFQTAGAS
jgi:2-polyprenyl-3-methyl-5-hydroxy-6-metoxy-1,4-benzoquinol methylase